MSFIFMALKAEFVKSDQVYIIAGLVLIMSGIFLVANSGIFTSISGAVVSNATNITNVTIP